MKFPNVLRLFFQCTIFILSSSASTTYAAINNVPIEDLDSTRIPRATVEPNYFEPDEPTPQIPETKPLPEVESGEEIVFPLQEIILQDNKVFTAPDLLPLYEKYLETQVSFNTLNTIAALLTKHYRNHGYILARVIIPPQKVKDGIVTLRIFEGFIDQVKIEGEFDGNPAFIEKFGRKIVATRPLTFKAIERYALLANDLPGITVKTIISPSEQTIGAADLTFLLKQNKMNAFGSYDNYASRNTGPTKFSVGTYINTLGYGLGSRSTAIFQATPDTKTSLYYQVRQQQYVGSEGLQLDVSASMSESRPRFVNTPSLQAFGFKSNSYSLHLGTKYPLLRSRTRNATIGLSLAFLDSKSDITKLDPPQNQYTDRIREISVDISTDFSDRWLGKNYIFVSMTHGLNFLGSTNPKNLDPIPSRAQAKMRFVKLTSSAQRQKYLTKQVFYTISVAGQYSFHPLLSSEEYGHGGSQFGRAYYPSTFVGDSGINAKAELTTNRYMPIDFIRLVQFYGFYDFGVMWNKQIKVTSPQPSRSSATSGGIGTRLYLAKALFGQVEVAFPFNRNNNRGNKHPSVLFSLAGTW